ncbi:MAG: aldo/keto reductase [Rhodobiaceae bacterium]|nr:aldo/keto reductase [Rhodobiaceae bacterium]
MKFKPLGRTGLTISELCFGTMSFGGDAAEDESARMYAACRDAGINFFDCADVYSKGAAETILGKLMKGHRDELIVTTKAFMPLTGDVNAGGANRRHIMRAVEASLKRLGTDWIDVYFMHRWDSVVPLEETLRALDDLVTSGKVAYIGASNYAAWQIAKGLGISAARDMARFDVIQPMYNLVKRQAETEILPLAEAEGLGVISYSPVGGGLLSGKYGPDRRPDRGRIMSNAEYTARYGEDWVFDVAGAFAAYAEKANIHPVSLAVAWVGAHKAISAPIIGARDLDQLRPSLDAVNIAMTPELRAEIAALSRTPPVATDRREEATG